MGYVGGHCLQVAVVDAQHHVTRVWEADMWAYLEQVFNVVYFDQGSHLEFGSQDEHVNQPGLTEAFGDEKYCIGTCSTSFVDLIRVN